MSQDICKVNSRCFNPETHKECVFWLHQEASVMQSPKAGFFSGSPDISVPASSQCWLFGNTHKDDSQSLICCDKIYGPTYEGRP